MGGTVLVSVGKIPGIGSRLDLVKKKKVIPFHRRMPGPRQCNYFRYLHSLGRIIRAEYNDAMLRDFEFAIAPVRITQHLSENSTEERSNLKSS